MNKAVKPRRTPKKPTAKISLGDALRMNPKAEERHVRSGYEQYQAAISAQEKRHESSSRDIDNAAKEAASYLIAKATDRKIVAFTGACFRKCASRDVSCGGCVRFSNYVPKEESDHGQETQECVEAGS